MKKIYSLLTLFILVLTANAQTVVTFDFSANEFGKTALVDFTDITKEGVTISMTGSKINTQEARFYKNKVMTISAGTAIQKIVFTGVTYSANYPVTGLTLTTDGALANGEWTGSANSVGFGNTAQVRFTKIEVTLGNASGVVVEKPVITPAGGNFTAPVNVSISVPANTSVYYTTDGSTPKATSTSYTAPFTLNTDGTTTVKAVAIDADGNASAVEQQTFTIDLPGINESIFTEPFNGGLGTFTPQETESDSAFSVWAYVDQYKAAVAKGFVGGKAHAAKEVLTSGTIDLTGYKNVKMSFSQAANYFKTTPFSDQCKVLVREAGEQDWTTLTLPVVPAGNSFTFASSGDIDLSAYNGKKIEVGFSYSSTTAQAGTWEIQNLRIFGDRDDATGIGTLNAAPAQEVIYDLSGRRVQKAVKGVYIINGKKVLVK